MTPELIDSVNQDRSPLKAGTRRMCARCGLPKPRDQFKIYRHRLTGNLLFDSHCKACSKDRRRYQKRRAAEKKRQDEFRAAVARMRGESIKAPHVSELWAEMVGEWGGLTKFVREYKAQVDAAIVKGAGTKTVLDAFKSITQLSVHSSNLRGTAPDMANLTDEDIENQLRVMTMRVLKQTPKMLEDMIESGSISVPSITPNPEYADPLDAPAVDQPEVPSAPTV